MENFKNLLEQELLNREFELKPTQNKISAEEAVRKIEYLQKMINH